MRDPNANPLRIGATVGPRARLLLGALPFLVVVACYSWISHARHAENPRDKLAPNLKQLGDGIRDVWELRLAGYVEVVAAPGDTAETIAKRVSGSASFADRVKADPPLEDLDTGKIRALQPGETVKTPRTERRIVVDTVASLKRLALGLGLAAVLSMAVGIVAACFSHLGATVRLPITGLAKIPPLAILPIIFILAGAGEWSKIIIILVGVAPTMTLDIMQRVSEVPRQLVVKAYTLGAGSVETVVDVIMPMVWPHVINSLRLALGPAWVYLIAAEAISADAGLGYRIFVVQRQLGMNVILLYVVWIMVIGLLMDHLLARFLKWRYSWMEQNR